MKLNSPAPIVKGHETASFDCGVEPLNLYLRRFALQNHQNRASRTYVATRGETIVGYYTLSNGSVSLDQVPKRVAQGMGSYPVPVTLLARLAVDITEKGAGLGRGLAKDALLRAFQASQSWWVVAQFLRTPKLKAREPSLCVSISSDLRSTNFISTCS